MSDDKLRKLIEEEKRRQEFERRRREEEQKRINEGKEKIKNDEPDKNYGRPRGGRPDKDD